MVCWAARVHFIWPPFGIPLMIHAPNMIGQKPVIGKWGRRNTIFSNTFFYSEESYAILFSFSTAAFEELRLSKAF